MNPSRIARKSNELNISAHYVQKMKPYNAATENKVLPESIPCCQSHYQKKNSFITGIYESGCLNSPDSSSNLERLYSSYCFAEEVVKMDGLTLQEPETPNRKQNRLKLGRFKSSHIQIKILKQISEPTPRYDLKVVEEIDHDMGEVSEKLIFKRTISPQLTPEAICSIRFYRGLRRRELDE